MKMVFVSIYCNKSFPCRIFHNLARQNGVEPHTIFFKNSQANLHTPVTDKEREIFADIIRQVQPDMIGISVLAPYVMVARDVVKLIRDISPVPIILGGKYPTTHPDKALDFADYVVVGEGELVLKEIFSRFQEGKPLSNCQGLWHKDGDGKVVDNGLRHQIEDLDTVPFQAIGEEGMYFIENDSLSLVDPELNNPDLWIMTARGCVYQCSFCVNSLLKPLSKGYGKFVRQRSADNVISEIKERINKNKVEAKSVFFVDEVFGTSIKWTEEFSGKYKREIDLPFCCEMIPSMIKEKNIALLAHAGLTSIDFGIQSGDDSLRNGVMNRPGDNAQIMEKIRILQKYKVEPLCDLILENPFETVSTLKTTINLLLQLPLPIRFNTFKMQFFPKYPFTEAALQQGFISEKDITDEKIAENCLYNWAFVPKIVSLKYETYLENGIFLLCKGALFSRTIAKILLMSGNPIFGIFVNMYAASMPMFRNIKAVSKLLMDGRFLYIFNKIIQRIRGLRH